MFWRSKPTTKKVAKRQPKTLKQILSETLTKEVNKDPELKRELALREGGYADLVKRQDPLEKKRQQIKDIITDKALERIQNDPELADEFVSDQVAEILSDGKRPHRREEELGGVYQTGSSLEDLPQLLDNIDELKARLGGGGEKGFGSVLKDPEVITAILGFLQQMTAPKMGSQPTRTYIVQVDSQIREVSETEFKQLQQAGQIKPVATTIGQPKPETIQAVKLEEKAVPALPEMIKQFDLDSITSLMELEPQGALEQLSQESESGMEQSRFILGFLSTATYEGIVNLIAPYKDNPEVSPAIQKILSPEGRQWTESIIKLIKGEK